MIGSNYSTLCAVSGQKNYTVVSHLGEGSFGSVYLVEDNKGKKYALKKIKVDPFNIKESQTEIQVMKKLSHHNLVKIYDFQVEKDKQTVEILMEYCEEGDLFHYYKKKNKALTVREILKIFKQIVQAFISMNVKGVFHRDLKPQNILLTKGLVIKIADFGCARSISNYDITKIDDFSLDKGTPIYASPEQLMNEKYSSKCDVWSGGVLLYFIYYGEHPFIDQAPHKTLNRIKNRTQNKTIQLPEDSDPTIAKIIQLTLIFEDQERASWRQLWLSRLFAEKVDNVKAYVEYLHRLSFIANTMTRMFWVARKPFEITKKKDQIFIYFFIKFQCTIMLQAKEINKYNKKHEYLFAPNAYSAYEPGEDFIKEIKKDYADRERFFNSIKESMKTKQANKEIKEKETKRVSAFCDLDYTLKYGYYILLEIKEQLSSKSKEEIDYKVWTFIAKWINFEKWFSFEKQPKIEKVLADADSISDPKKFILDEIERYEEGDVV